MPIAQIASWPVRNTFNERIDNSFTHYTSFYTNHKRKWKWRIENCILSSHLTSVPSAKPSVWGELLCCCLRLTPVLPGNVSLFLWYIPCPTALLFEYWLPHLNTFGPLISSSPSSLSTGETWRSGLFKWNPWKSWDVLFKKNTLFWSPSARMVELPWSSHLKKIRIKLSSECEGST